MEHRQDKVETRLLTQAGRLFRAHEEQPRGIGQPGNCPNYHRERKVIDQLAFRCEHQNGCNCVFLHLKSAYRYEVSCSGPGRIGEQALAPTLSRRKMTCSPVPSALQAISDLHRWSELCGGTPCACRLARRPPRWIRRSRSDAMPRLGPAHCRRSCCFHWPGPVCVVQIVAVRRESGARAKKPGLWRHDRNLAARDHLFHPQAAFAFPPTIGHQSAVGRDGWQNL